MTELTSVNGFVKGIGIVASQCASSCVLRLDTREQWAKIDRGNVMGSQRCGVLFLLFVVLAGARCLAADLTPGDQQYLQGLTGMGASSPLFSGMTTPERATLHDLINDPATLRYSQRDTLVLGHLRDVHARQCADWAKAHTTPSCPPAPDPSVQPGKEIADRLCHTCHLLGTSEARSFHKMAATQVPTKDQLRAALSGGHRMSPITLNDQELTELHGYIESLK